MNSFQKALLPIITFARIDTRRLFRDKVAIFFVFLFPLIFLVVFGSIFGGSDGVSFRVAFINNSKTDFAQQFDKQIKDNKIFKIDGDARSLAEAKQKINRGQIDAIIVLPADFGTTAAGVPAGQATVLYDQDSRQAGVALSAVMEEVFSNINQMYAPYKPPFSVQSQAITTAGLTEFDYTFAGLFGFSLLSMGIFGPTQVFPRLKQRGVLRRYRTTTLKVWQYFVGNVLSTAFVGLLSASLMFITALLFFDLQMRGNYFNLLVVTLLGAVMLFGIGLSVGGWAKNENQAAPLAQLTTLPMMFLSGVFFPVFLMPEALQRITQFIPLTPIVESVRRIITENASLLDLAPQLGVMFGWTVIIYCVAFKVFRWE